MLKSLPYFYLNGLYLNSFIYNLKVVTWSSHLIFKYNILKARNNIIYLLCFKYIKILFHLTFITERRRQLKLKFSGKHENSNIAILLSHRAWFLSSNMLLSFKIYPNSYWLVRFVASVY